ATGFWNSESVLLDESLATKDAAWANRAGSIVYRADAGSTRLELTAGASGYRAELPLQPGRTAGEPPPPALLASAETNRARLVGEATWGAPEQPIRAGLSLEQLGVALAAEELGGGPSVASEGSTRALGAFLDATRPLAPGLTLRGGVRVDRYEGRSTNVAPRIALRWELTSEALLTVAMGRYHQPTRSPEVEVERTLAEVSAEGLPPSELLPVATADHVVLSLDQRLGGKVRLGLQGFWKRFEGLPTASDEQVRNSGIDVRVLTAGDIGTVWLGYGLSWFWSKVDLSGRASEFVGRHLLSAGVSGRLGGPLRGEARIAYGAGLPYTSIPFGTADASSEDALAPAAGRDYAAEPPPLVSGLDEDFLRLDLEVHMALEPEWGGRSWQLRPYVRVLNALDRRDALFYTFQAWRSEEVRPLAERPLLPILGVSVSF
ncbi:MAG TPA: TonB-dependent receptor, partial [Longimicrobiales bacterium]|nr:TonB-dependent receptor [Longimicrobiales bacterium]